MKRRLLLQNSFHSIVMHIICIFSSQIQVFRCTFSLMFCKLFIVTLVSYFFRILGIFHILNDLFLYSQSQDLTLSLVSFQRFLKNANSQKFILFLVSYCLLSVKADEFLFCFPVFQVIRNKRVRPHSHHPKKPL